MAKNKHSIVQFKRKRLHKTDYVKRRKYLSSRKLRLVIRLSLNNILLQVVEFHQTGDKIICSAHSSELKKMGWKYHTGNVPSAYLTGFLLAKKSKIKDAIPDFGLRSSVKGSRLYAAIKGVLDGGLKIPCSEEVFPKEDALKGATIAKFASEEKYKNQFKVLPKGIIKDFEEIKGKIK